ncbi:MAG TPA: BglII/BstYI family type II restriction endonuclease [Thermodesulfobacteriota bacterium]|nr:BglII/BstYI family type II restriction endonuclease [Thermodesulfobacteriota bacterium]
MTITFKHLIGKSTLKEGISIHKNFESFFESPESGKKREIILSYGNNRSVTVVLRRLDNVRKHVQIKYTNKTQASFVDWLNDVFGQTKKGRIGEFLEFQKVAPNIFKLTPITIDMAHNAKLYVADSMYHKADETALRGDAAFGEVERIISGISFKVDEGQSFYNREIESEFSKHEWRREIKAIPELDLKCDYRKERIQVEVEFGNARAYYQDYIKFMLSYLSKQIHLGILVTPTLGFANILCEIGKQKALQRGRKTYSGMMHFEKAFKEFHYLKPFFDMPIVILGIDINPF